MRLTPRTVVGPGAVVVLVLSGVLAAQGQPGRDAKADYEGAQAFDHARLATAPERAASAQRTVAPAARARGDRVPDADALQQGRE